MTTEAKPPEKKVEEKVEEPKFDASEYVKYLSKNLGGSGGGGRKDFAQAGGTDVDKIDQVVKVLIEKI